jgi:hypothetical protein
MSDIIACSPNGTFTTIEVSGAADCSRKQAHFVDRVKGSNAIAFVAGLLMKSWSGLCD